MAEPSEVIVVTGRQWRDLEIKRYKVAIAWIELSCHLCSFLFFQTGLKGRALCKWMYVNSNRRQINGVNAAASGEHSRITPELFDNRQPRQRLDSRQLDSQKCAVHNTLWTHACSHEECRPLNSTWLHLNLLLDANRLLVQSSAAMEKRDINSGLCLPLWEKRERGRSCVQSLRRPDCVCIFRARGNTLPAYLRFILISHIADNN